MDDLVIDTDFYKGRKVLLTGHTGFKGSWLSLILLDLGADVTGYSLPPPTQPALFKLLNLEKDMRSIIGDLRDKEFLLNTVNAEKPDIVIHMAAQPIVREGYIDPVGTYETNIMGTVNILESIRQTEGVLSFVNVTTDKVYEDKELAVGYKEDDILNGHDPYSNSKSCSELVTSCYRKSFFQDRETAISTVRAGNVIGGGDYAKDRIIPDCVRAAIEGQNISVRNPFSIRPYQHVLEPLFAYLLVASAQAQNRTIEGSYNVGPDDADCVNTQTLVELFCKYWGDDIYWEDASDNGPPEASYLKLDSALIKSVFCWTPKWNIDDAVSRTVAWTKAYINNEDVKETMRKQIEEYLR